MTKIDYRYFNILYELYKDFIIILHFQFIGDMSTDEPGYLYVVSSKFHRFFLKNLNPNEFNNRILRLKLPGSLTHSHLASYGLTAQTTYSPHYPAHFGSYIIPPVSRPPSTAAGLFYNTPTTSLQTLRHEHRNPFTALNHGETFPPSKETRDTLQPSYLDTLQKITSNGYYYNRATRSADKQRE